MKYALFDEHGNPTAFYDPEIHAIIPAECVEISDGQWIDLISSNGLGRWIDGGVIITEPPPPVATIPQSISRFQARAALLAAGRLSDVEAAVAAADPFAQLAWAEAQEWRRDSPTLLALAKGIGLTDAEIDDLFIQAAAIRA